MILMVIALNSWYHLLESMHSVTVTFLPQLACFTVCLMLLGLNLKKLTQWLLGNTSAMADLPSKRVREDEKAPVSHTSTERTNNNSVANTLVRDNSLEYQSNTKMSRNETKRKQVTLDRYWSKKLDPKVESVRTPTMSENTVVVTLPETLKYGSNCAQKVEADYKQTLDDNAASETMPETLKYGSTPDTDATVETVDYDSDSVAASESSATDNVSSIACDDSPQHLQLGTSFDEMAAVCETGRELPPLCPSANHTVLFRPDTADEHCASIPQPKPDNVIFEDACWDNYHVRLPYSPQNKLLVNRVVVGRWGKIVSSLNAAKWNASCDIEKAILSYNKYKWDFTELHRYFQTLTEEEHDLLFSQTLPKMVELAVNLPSICTQPIPLLRKQKEASITMSQQQAATLLANAFFCTFPSRNTNYGSEDDTPCLPSINFNNLYRRASNSIFHARHAKLDCLFHYFKRVTTDMPRGTLTFKRQVTSYIS